MSELAFYLFWGPSNQGTKLLSEISIFMWKILDAKF